MSAYVVHTVVLLCVCHSSIVLVWCRLSRYDDVIEVKLALIGQNDGQREGNMVFPCTPLGGKISWLYPG